MRAHPIIFSGPMASAIFGGAKMQTRRHIKWSPLEHASGHNLMHSGVSVGHHCTGDPTSGWVLYSRRGDGAWEQLTWPSKKFQINDHLWGKEPWRIGAWNEEEGAFAIDYFEGPRREWLKVPDDPGGWKFADLASQCLDELRNKGINPKYGYRNWRPGESPLRWRNPRFMPRWASRLLLEVTDVRVERLQDIDEDDLKAEGIHFDEYDFFNPPHREAFARLWDSLYAKRPECQWAANPWVWRISFKRIKEAK